MFTQLHSLLDAQIMLELLSLVLMAYLPQLLPLLLLQLPPRLRPLKLLPRERLSQLPRPLLRLMLIQRLTHGCTTLDFMDMDMDTMDMLHSPTAMLHTPTPMSTLTMASHTLTMARDLLMPRLTLLSSTAITDILTLMVMDTDMLDSHTLTTHTPTMERDLLMLSQRPRLMLTHISSMVDTT